MAPFDPDATVRLVPRRRRIAAPGAMLAILVLAFAGGGWWWLARPPRVRITTAGMAEILADRPHGLAVFRFASNPAILVLDFASLAEQGRMLDRVGAWVEKAGLPRDRVLDDAALDAAIRASGATPETYYYGHDYRAADLVRFFALAAKDGIRLDPQERWLHGLVRQEGWDRGRPGALISIPAVGSDPLVDADARATILGHELSHGEYFTDPAYAALTQGFWHQDLTDADRAAFTRFLGAQGYDTTDEDLIANETQAYLMHTPDPRFFTAAAVGLAPARVAALRRAFYARMSPGWLRDMTPAPPAPRQRRPVSRTMAAPARRRPSRRTVSIAA